MSSHIFLPRLSPYHRIWIFWAHLSPYPDIKFLCWGVRSTYFFCAIWIGFGLLPSLFFRIWIEFRRDFVLWLWIFVRPEWMGYLLFWSRLGIGQHGGLRATSAGWRGRIRGRQPWIWAGLSAVFMPFYANNYNLNIFPRSSSFKTIFIQFFIPNLKVQLKSHLFSPLYSQYRFFIWSRAK